MSRRLGTVGAEVPWEYAEYELSRVVKRPGEICLWLAVVERAIKDYQECKRRFAGDPIALIDLGDGQAYLRFYAVQKWAFTSNDVGSLTWIAEHIADEPTAFIECVQRSLEPDVPRGTF